jgi:predicted RNA methylase
MVAAAATMSSDARVRGVEHREHFVEIARNAATKLGVTAEFTHGTLADVDPESVNGLYLFNPFGENVAAADDHLDETVELSEERYRRDLATLDRFLQRARGGTRVVTYCGHGGEMPSPYVLALREHCAGTLELWVKPR